jgi:hypothetical protein
MRHWKHKQNREGASRPLYSISASDLSSISDVEIAFGTTKLLPPWEAIPEDFRKGNQYTALVSNLFYGRPLPDSPISIVEGVKHEDLSRAVHAHLISYAPKHEHKIAGIGYMISKVATLG